MLESANWAGPEFYTLIDSLIFWLDIFLKSIVVSSLPLLVTVLPGYQRAHQLRHSLWLYAFAAITLLPVACLANAQLGDGTSAGRSLFTISVIASEKNIADGRSSSVFSLALAAFTIYLGITFVLLTRLLNSYRSVVRIVSSARSINEAEALDILHRVRSRLDVSTQIQLKASSLETSPFSFGFKSANIVLPASFSSWSKETLENVLLHEVMHIKRKDWLSLILVRALTCLYWLNPLCWLLAAKLEEEAEICCDQAVLTHGQSATVYADNLLAIAKESLDVKPMLAQMLVSKSKFKKRIKLVLEGNMVTHNNRYSRTILQLFTLALLTTSVTLPVVSADKASEEYYPTHTPVPYYPRVAADEGIEGHVLLEFTVLPNGNVDASSIVVVEESPAGIFTRSAISAAETFEFSPRIEDGRAVEAPGVQFMYRYALED